MVRGIVLFFKEIYKRFNHARVMDLAAQCAYYFLLSLFPLLIFVLTILSYLPITAEDILWIFGSLAPQSAYNLIQSNIHGILGVNRPGLVSFGLVFTLWTAIFGIESIVRAVNFSYGITRRRGFFTSKLIALLLLLALISGIISVFVFNVFGARISDFMEFYLKLPSQLVFLWNTFRLLTNFVVLIVVFLVLYLVAPLKRVGLREAIPGALFASFGWHYISLGFSFYVNNFANYSATYGSLGAIVVLMLWLYLSALVLILGGQVNAVILYIRTKT